ncbi:UNVERIFIED_CONTAM: hypothetical protein RMT77_018460 [Armadillidium vulgare]
MLSPKAAAFQVEALLKGHASFDGCSHMKDEEQKFIPNEYEEKSGNKCNKNQSNECLDSKYFNTMDEYNRKFEQDGTTHPKYCGKKFLPMIQSISQREESSPDSESRWKTFNHPSEGRKRGPPIHENLFQRRSKKYKLNQEHLPHPIERNLESNQLPAFLPYSHQRANRDYGEVEVLPSGQITSESTQIISRIDSPKYTLSTSLANGKNLRTDQKSEEKSSARTSEGTLVEKLDDRVTNRPCRSTKKDVVVSLQHRSLWAEFSRHQTEMIVTKNGRRMFPVIKIRVQGLKPDALYMIYLDVVPVDGKRYRYAYLTSTWVVAGAGDTQQRERLYIHPESPTTGKRWMEMMIISFDKLKLTNNKSRDMKGQIYLQSMQKYLPRIWVQKLQNNCNTNEINGHEIDVNELHTIVDRSQALSFTFPETNFITVTAYQNQKITRLKINTNPFAKGFRDSSKYKDVNRHLMTSLHCGNNSCQSSQHIPFANLPHFRPPFLAPLPFFPTIPFPPPLSHMRPTTLPNRWPSISSVISSQVDNSTCNSIFSRSFQELGRNEFLLNNLRIQKYKTQGEDNDLK